MKGAQSTEQLEAIHSRKTDVDHDQIKNAFGSGVQRCFTVVNYNRVMLRLHQRRADSSRQRNVIFDNQNMHDRDLLKTDGELCGENVIVVAQAGGFVLKTVLQLQLRV